MKRTILYIRSWFPVLAIFTALFAGGGICAGLTTDPCRGNGACCSAGNSEDNVAASVFRKGYALLFKDGYDCNMNEGECHDQRGERVLSFFSDERDKRSGVSMITNVWHVVPKYMNFGEERG